MVILLLILFSFLTQANDLSVESLFKDQVKDYQQKSWSKVYARGNFYRHQYLRNNDEVKAAFSPNFYKLEIFALAEKCQWELVDQLVNDFKRLESIKYKDTTRSNEIIKKINSFKAYKLVTKEDTVENVGNDNNTILVDGIDWSEIKDLNMVEIDLEDTCTK
jgi:hypothetical protein